MRVLIAPPQHYPWLCQRAGVTPGPEFRALEVVDDDWGIHAMAGLDGWTGNTVSMHVACRNPHVIRQLARAAFMMAFVTCGKKLALCTVKGTNDRSLRLVRGLGFREVFRGKDYFADGVDFVGHEMRRDECRWLVKGAA
jgi:hypothetical protein